MNAQLSKPLAWRPLVPRTHFRRARLLHKNAANAHSVDFVQGTTPLSDRRQIVIARLDGMENGPMSLLQGTD